MNTWYDPKVKLPEDQQECLLMPLDHGGMCTIAVYGPITWHAETKMWLDIFRDPEAGSIVNPTQVGKWCDWASIAPKEDDAQN